MIRSVVIGIVTAAALAAGALPAVVAADGVLPRVDPTGSYVVLVSDATAKADGWMEAATILRKKHEASLIVYPAGNVWSRLPELTALRPRYAAFVCRP